MPEFIMDKSEAITFPSGEVLAFTQLAAFTQGYIEAMLFTETSCIPMAAWTDPESQEAVREGQADGNIPSDAGFGDIHPDTFAAIQRDCIAFEHQAADLLIEAHGRGYTREQAGRDFWYTRNGHGVGFWDREALDDKDAYLAAGSPRVGDPTWADYKTASANSLGERLTKVAESFGQTWSDFVPDESSPTGYGYIHLS